MPAPHHLCHPAPHSPHRHTTRVPSPLLTSIRYLIATLYRLTILDLYIRTSPHPTSSPPNSTSIYAPRTHLLPHVLTQPSAALSTLPHSVPPLFRTHSPVLSTSQPSFYTPPHPFPVHPPLPLLQKSLYSLA